ncbi:hypothetical protein IHQ56_06295 [Methylobacillus flagellatus]|uniref:virulence factor TspB C-terminal domain-related protein n=1 Tax=Methylobacillus flagellatus TaxID=405 RepID=UPI0028539AF6|nr:virulence factor TspB C-terminal domain-related protein [Methylobacillus flagellatus]MDR5171423.1 hypothetical protein [Methylobacillus flagellatus]
MKYLALIPLLLIGATAQAATIEIGTPSYVRPGADGQLYYWPADERAPPRVAYPGMENNARDINAPTTKGRVPITVNQKTPVSLNKLAGPALNLAKRVGPLGLGLTAAGLLCEYSDICSGPSDPDDPASEPTWTLTDPASKPMPYIRFATNTQNGRYPYREFSTYTEACDFMAPLTATSNGFVMVSIQSCTLSNNQVLMTILDTKGNTQGTFGPATRIWNCPATHTLNGATCQPNNPDRRLPIPPNEWPGPDDVPELNTPDIIPDLIDGGEPIPVETPEIDPKTVPSPAGSTTETIRNGAGEPIGTKTTDTTVTVTPAGPTTVNITETTTITETNITNNTTTTTVQDTTLPNDEDQSEKPKEDQDIETDNVQDKDLDRFEVPDTFDYESWGGGSCPGDPAVSVLGKSVTIPVHTVCDGLTMLRPVVLIIAFLAAAYIISGALRT